MWLAPFEVFPFALGHFGFNQFPVGMRRSPQHPSGFQVVLQRLFALVPTVSAVSPVRDSDRTSRPGRNPALEGSLASMFVPLNYRVEVVGTQPLRMQGIFVEVREVAAGLWVVRIAGVRNWVLALSCTLCFALAPLHLWCFQSLSQAPLPESWYGPCRTRPFLFPFPQLLLDGCGGFASRARLLLLQSPVVVVWVLSKHFEVRAPTAHAEVELCVSPFGVVQNVPWAALRRPPAWASVKKLFVGSGEVFTVEETHVGDRGKSSVVPMVGSSVVAAGHGTCPSQEACVGLSRAVTRTHAQCHVCRASSRGRRLARALLVSCPVTAPAAHLTG